VTAARPRVVLAPGRDGPIVARHPWVFSGAIARVEGEPQIGTEVEVVDSGGTTIARGLWNPDSQIRVRCYAWNRFQRVDDALLTVRVGAAIALRERLGLMDPLGACRVIFSEGDGLSGLVVDRFGEYASVQFTSAALWAHRETIVAALRTHLKPRGMVLRTEKGILEEEGLEISDGPFDGELPDGPVEIRENGFWYSVDLRTGQKTGYYLDQRDNRARAERYAGGRRVADICSYSGGFSLPMLRAGATSLTMVDISASALELAERNLHRNDLLDDRVEIVKADAPKWMAEAFEEGRRYEMVVLDPPRFARSSRGVKGALKGYANWNEAAVRLIEPNGILMTHSCTGRVSREAFLQTLSEVERRTGRRVRVLEMHGQPADHPVAPTCPETEYLKCVVCTVE
jgi:23S rRNA (cytosine1962-C5)-methyltransferase